MTLFLACNDAFWSCATPEEFFDFGIWLPPDDHYRKQLLGEKGTEEVQGENQKQKTSAVTAPKPPPKIPEKPKESEEQKEFKENFKDKAAIGQLVDFARSKGYAPSQEDIAKLAAKKKENINYEEYMEFVTQISHPEDNPDHLVEFFQSYDHANTGTLPLKVIKNLLMNFGEPLTQEEVDGIIKELAITSDPVDYMTLAKKLLES